jgi:hypothetical protein
MTDEKTKTLGQIAYDAWRGRYWGDWESLLEENKQPWEVAALAIVKELERRKRRHLRGARRR